MLKRLIVYYVAGTLIGVNVSFAQEATPEPTQEVISPQLAAQMAGLEQITQTLRGLTAKEPVEHRFPTRQQTIDYLKASYDREFPPEKFAELKSFYVALGLLPADIDLQSVYLGLLGSQVAGYYDPDTKTMNVLEPDAGLAGAAALVHRPDHLRPRVHPRPARPVFRPEHAAFAGDRK